MRDAPPSPSLTNSEAPRQSTIGRFRWVICALLLFGVTKNYMDRQLIGVLKITLQHDLHWDENNYANMVFVFQGAYALGILLVGRLIDRLGTRVGYALAMALWSLASMAQGLVSSLAGFGVARFFLGLGESGVFPASLKATAEWFPKKERAFATGIFNAGSNLGAMATPPLVTWITAHWGWRYSFFLIGAVGFVWLGAWLLIYRKPEDHPSCSGAELTYIRSDPAEPPTRIRWIKLAAYRQTWAFAAGKFIIDPVWWFYLFWVPGFLKRKHGLTLPQIVLPIIVIYLMADVGSVAGGWFSSFLIHRGRSVNTARKAAMLICAVSVLPVIFAPRVASPWASVLLIGLAAAAHQGFSCNLLTLPSDIFPSRAVASVAGMGGMAGAVGGMLVAKLVGYRLQHTGSYAIPFLIAGLAYLIAFGAIHLLSPRLEPVRLSAAQV
jgi:ACS family hexuronate transporter-like MFS transporter